MRAPTESQDAEHLRLLSIFHYVVGGFIGMFSLVPVIHLAVGVLMLSGAIPAESASDTTALQLVGGLFVAIGGVFVVLGLTTAICVILAGRYLARHIHHTFCLVVAGVECLFMPFGTILGIFTIVVLSKESVRLIFACPAPPPVADA